MNIFTKNNYFADVQKKNSCVDGGYINKYLWIYTSCASLRKSQPHKQHIWFLPTHKPTLKNPKELFFANARNETELKC